MARQKSRVSLEPKVPPPVGSGDLPHLFRLPGQKFQALCRDLLDGEPGVRQCEEIGINGQSQFGIDLIVHLDIEGIDVAQCKAEQDFPPRKIRDASDKFLDHWEYWKNRGVKRFLVLVGSEVKETQRIEEILRQKGFFAERNIGYELWPSSKIVNKLRRHRGIVAHHLSDAWTKTICGNTTDSVSSIALAGQTALNERLIIAVGTATDETLVRMKDAWQAGRRTEARQLIAKAKADRAVWLTLAPELRANILRFEASVAMDSNSGAEGITLLLREAAQLAPGPDDLRLESALAWKTNDRQRAIDLLSGATDVAALSLRAAIFGPSG